MSVFTNTSWVSVVVKDEATGFPGDNGWRLDITKEDAKGKLTGIYNNQVILDATHTGNKIKFTFNGGGIYEGHTYGDDETLIIGRKHPAKQPKGGPDDPVWVAEQSGGGIELSPAKSVTTTAAKANKRTKAKS